MAPSLIYPIKSGNGPSAPHSAAQAAERAPGSSDPCYTQRIDSRIEGGEIAISRCQLPHHSDAGGNSEPNPAPVLPIAVIIGDSREPRPHGSTTYKMAQLAVEAVIGLRARAQQAEHDVNMDRSHHSSIP